MRRVIFTVIMLAVALASLHAQETSKPKATEAPKPPVTVPATREQTLEVQLALSQIETAKAKAESLEVQAAMLKQQAKQIEDSITPKLKAFAASLKINFDEYEPRLDQGNVVFVKKTEQAKK